MSDEEPLDQCDELGAEEPPTSPEEVVLTRTELYEQVWTQPVMVLAKRHGLSDRGLGKLCARYNIPVPPRGYWARKRVGQRVKRSPLPASGSQSGQIRFMEASVVGQERTGAGTAGNRLRAAA